MTRRRSSRFRGRAGLRVILARRVRLAALVVTAAAVTVSGQSSGSGDAAPVLSPTEALETFQLQPGYRLELVAAEPLVQDPVLIEWDTQRRLWVIELPNYMRDLAASGEHEPTGRVVVLEDTDGDGAMDRRTVFADGLVQPRGLRLLEGGVLVGEPPDVLLLEDVDGDLRADRRTPVASGYGQPETNVEVNANGLYWAIDNRMYTAGIGADLYLELEDGAVRTGPSIARGQWGLTQDDAGRIYRNHNESVVHVDLVPTPYYARNPDLLRTRGSHERLIDVDGEVNTVWPARRTPGTNRAYQHGVLREDGTLSAFTAACAPTIYRGDRLPAELYGNLFAAEPAANLVSRIVLPDDGTTLRARKAYPRGEFVASTDERFRPVDLSNGPDGTLYIVDFYRGLIQHRLYITEYLRDHVLARKLEQPVGFGRIYRVVHDTTRRDTATALPASTPALVPALEHPSGWWRDAVQQRLVERRSAATAPALARLLAGSTDWRTRLHALWTLDGIGAIEPVMVERALKDPARDVRAGAVRVAERWLGETGHPIRAAVLAGMEDPDWAVPQQLAASLGALPPGAREEAAASLLERHGADPIALDAALSGLRGLEGLVLARVLDSSARQTPAREAAIAMLSATVLRSGRESDAQDVLARIEDSGRAVWQRSALLRGAEIALLDAPMPGTVPPRRRPQAAGSVPCPTCPGGRAGPGGAYAFPRPPAELPAGRGAGPVLRLARAPAIVGLAGRGDELGARASAVLARVSWPGKPGAAAPAIALTAVEQQRFEAGRSVYRNICQACHQPDGRGQERLAPTLIGSPFTLGQPEIPIRILLHGKQGAAGLMPPVGAALDDEQIAGVLTYVRREWGQGGSPVDPATVAAVRAATRERKQPWTPAELDAIR